MGDQNDFYKWVISEAVLTHAGTAYLLFNVDNPGRPVCLYTNQAFHRLTGGKIDTSGDSYLPLLQLLDAEKPDIDSVETALTGSVPGAFTLRLGCSGEKPFWATVQITPFEMTPELQKAAGHLMSTEPGKLYALMAIRDVSDEKRTAEDLERSNGLVVDAQKVKEKFLSSMSHEIRTPMSGVLGMSELLSGTNLDSEQREYINAIISSAKSLVNILSDVIDYSKAESGKITIVQKPFHLPDVLGHLKKSFDHRDEKKEIEFTFLTADDLPETVVGDESRFLQVLMQLTGNAFKFTDEGFVRVHVKKDSEQNGLVWIKATVEDSGLGIPEELSDTIFESFSKASKSTMSRYGGTGLGLPIVKSLVGLMDGQISVRSRENEGSLFTVKIPFETVEDEASAKAAKKVRPGSDAAAEITSQDKDTGSGSDEAGVHTESGRDNTNSGQLDGNGPAGSGYSRAGGENSPVNPTLSGRIILVVDDHPINRKLLEGMLERAGIEVISVDNGEDAVKRVADQAVDLVLMDVHMPGMNGLDATRKIRSDLPDNKNGVPVIAVSASVMEADMDACRSAGMDGFVSKPFTFESLIQTIDRHLNSKSEAGSDLRATRIEDEEREEGDQIINFDALKEMTAGDEEMMLEMIDLFLVQTPKLLQSMRDHYEEGDLIAMGKDAHTLKPTFYYLGMEYAIPHLLALEMFKNPESADRKASIIVPAIRELEDIVKRAYPAIQKEADRINS